MAPWCNRIAAARTRVGEQVVDLASNFTDGSVMHGQVYAAPWAVDSDGCCSIDAGGNGWPWPFRCSLRPSVAETTLTVELSLTNLAPGRMPAGLGLHPWFRRPLEARVDANAVVPSNVDPDATVIPASGPWDLHALQPVPDDVDATWLAPTDPAVELRWPDLGVAATMRLRSTVGACIVVASPSALDAVAIEPQTHAPQGLRRYLRGDVGGLVEIEPGMSLQLTVELAFREVGTVRSA
jgi:aldose 1-epimerase